MILCLYSPLQPFFDDSRQTTWPKPPLGQKVSVHDQPYQVKYQRAFEAVRWPMAAAI